MGVNWGNSWTETVISYQLRRRKQDCNQDGRATIKFVKFVRSIMSPRMPLLKIKDWETGSFVDKHRN